MVESGEFADDLPVLVLVICAWKAYVPGPWLGTKLALVELTALFQIVQLVHFTEPVGLNRYWTLNV